MSWGEEQKKEIETIRERKITVKLSDADCDRLARKCGEHGLTIGELIENFVGDLVGGTYSNGSDERDYADQWFERCWFGMFPEPTLLNHLLNLGYEPEHYLDMLENVETIKSDIEITKQNIAEPSDEWKDIVYHKYNDDRTSYECVPCYNSVDEYIASEKEDLESYKADLEEALEELKDMRADWKPEKEPNMNEEIELIKKWVKEREDFMNRTRPKQIVIRVSEEELAQIKEKVEQSGKSQQQYIIEALTQSNIVNTDGIKELIPELKRVGNNLNQKRS